MSAGMDKAWFSEQIINMQDSMYRYAFCILKNDSDTKDAMQDAIVKAYENLETLNHPRKFKSWMMVILRNCTYDLIRKQKPYEELEEELAEYKKGPIVDKPHNKVVLEVFVKLLEKSGADLKKHGNKAIASRLAETITRLPLTTCQNYFSDRLKTTAHPDEVLKMNTAIKELGIEWQL